VNGGPERLRLLLMFASIGVVSMEKKRNNNALEDFERPVFLTVKMIVFK